MGCMYPRFALPIGLTLLLAVACTASPGGSPTPTPTPTPSQPTVSPAPTPPAAFYLRMYTTQALPPDATFNWLPRLTIADNTVIDANVAIVMIYPGPLFIQPVARSITDAGIAAIADEANGLGLLGDATDFSPEAPMPGAAQSHIDIVVDGATHELTGSADLPLNCGRDGCAADPGTPEAFTLFWQDLQNLDGWLAGELGGTAPYQPDRLAVLLADPQDDASLPQRPMAWPLETKFADFGVPFTGSRCATVSGEELDLLLPAVQAANQLTVFVDSEGVAQSLVVRVVVPGEPSPCGDQAVSDR